jgi:RNA polymerase sigma-54 factor
MLNISQQQKLLQKLSPQQIQYLELLQLPVLALEQRIKNELETNPLLEEGQELEQAEQTEQAQEQTEAASNDQNQDNSQETQTNENDYSLEDFMNDDPGGYKTPYSINEDYEDLPQPARTTLVELLTQQLLMLNLNAEERLLAEEIIGNIDEDGYLRRELTGIVDDINLTHQLSITVEQAEQVLAKVQRLEPPGIGSRTLQECLLVQLDSLENDEETVNLARTILKQEYEAFTKKHYHEIQRGLRITREQLSRALDIIQRLNPKPGEGTIEEFNNYIIPDFIVQKLEDEFVVTLNDRSVPPLRINKGYRDIISRKKRNSATSETRDFIRRKFEAAKWFINSIHQRRETMLKVMRAIIELQFDFFEHGEEYLRPMIYKDVAERIGMDISTISRVVNGKYVQTDYGVYELRYFFSELIETTDGDGISNKQVKRIIKEFIEQEDPQKPLSDDKLAAMVREKGINIARRTVAKYREQLYIPVARLRKKI